MARPAYTIKPRSGAPDGPLYVNFTDADGQRRRITTDTRDPKVAEVRALEILREHLVDKLPAEDRRAIASSETLAGMLRACFEKRWRKQGNVKGMRMLVGKIAREKGHLTWHSITYDRLRVYLEDELQLEPSTRNAYASAIRTAMVEHRRQHPDLPLPEFPRWSVTARKERFVSDEEEATIEAWMRARVCPAEPEWAYAADLFLLYLDTGMRCSEALTLQDPKNVRRAGNGRLDAIWLEHGETKSRKGRLVPLTERASGVLERVLASPLHGTWDYVKAGQVWRRCVRALGLEEITLHTLRHTCASRLVMGGCDLYQAALMLGHSHTEMTTRYAHLAPGFLQNAREILERRAWQDGTNGVFARLGVSVAEAAEIVAEALKARSGADVQSGTDGTSGAVRHIGEP